MTMALARTDERFARTIRDLRHPNKGRFPVTLHANPSRILEGNAGITIEKLPYEWTFPLHLHNASHAIKSRTMVFYAPHGYLTAEEVINHFRRCSLHPATLLDLIAVATDPFVPDDMLTESLVALGDTLEPKGMPLSAPALYFHRQHAYRVLYSTLATRPFPPNTRFLAHAPFLH